MPWPYHNTLSKLCQHCEYTTNSLKIKNEQTNGHLSSGGTRVLPVKRSNLVWPYVRRLIRSRLVQSLARLTFVSFGRRLASGHHLVRSSSRRVVVSFDLRLAESLSRLIVCWATVASTMTKPWSSIVWSNTRLPCRAHIRYNLFSAAQPSHCR